jgi:hypothetical protein
MQPQLGAQSGVALPPADLAESRQRTDPVEKVSAARGDARVEGLEQTGFEQGQRHLANIIVRGGMGQGDHQ